MWSRVRATVLVAAVGCLGCGGDDDGAVDPDANAGADAAGDGAVAVSCADASVTIDTATTFDIDTVTGTPIIHPYAAFDGDAVWLVYSAPDIDGTPVFDTYAARIGCDGSLLAAPQRVTSSPGVNEIDPSIAISGDTALITWISDSGVGPFNLDLVTRRMTTAGMYLDGTDEILETSRLGNPAPGNVLQAIAAPMPGGDFAVAAARGLDAASAFQMVGQRVGQDGTVSDDAVDGEFLVDVSQTDPAIAVRANGTAVMAWTSEPLNGDPEVRFTTIDAGWNVAAAPVSPRPGISGRPFLCSRGSGVDERVYLAFDADTGPSTEIILRDARLDVTASPEARFGGSGTNIYPIVATKDGGGAVIFHKLVQGASTEVYAAAFTFDGTTFVAGAEIELTGANSSFSVYAPAIAHIRDDIYFVSWTEGQSPDLNNRGRFIELTVP